MTIFRLKHDKASGRVAIYSVPSEASTDDAPLFAPFDHPDRLQWTTDGVQPSTSNADTKTVTVTIPAIAANSKFDGTIDLFAHGKGDACMVEGSFKDPDNPSTEVGFNGTMPVKVVATGHAVWLALGATNTHVVLVYFGITYAAIASFTVTVTASAYDYLASGAAPGPNLSAPPFLKWVKNAYAIIGRLIDTRRRYIRRVASGGDFAFATGPTLSIIGSGNTGAGGPPGSYVQNEVGWRWRYSCAGYVKQTTEAWNGSATNGGTYNAPYILVKR